MRRAGLAVMVLIGLGCGAPARPARPSAPDEPALEEAAGLRLLAVPRPTPGRVWLSLWIDAGSRDASPPAVATVAAWAVAPADAEARALPDGVELARGCDAAALDACVRSLAEALGARAVGPERLSASLERLHHDRARADADPSRAADALALEALLGPGATPLARAEDDARIDADAVRSFLTDHFGPDRALLVAVGDVHPDAVRAAAERAFASLPAARRARATRGAPATDARVEVGDGDALSAVTTFASAREAVAAAHRLIARLDGAQADVFPLRGTTAVMVRGAALEPGVLVDRMREVHEETERDAALPTPEDPRALARWHGARWVAGRGETSGGLGLGALVAGGRADRLVDDPDAPLRERVRGTLTAALADGPAFDGPVGESSAAARLPNGARVAGERLAGTDNLAVSVLFDGGAREETAREHGTTALLAAAAARACDEGAARELGAPAGALGISITPRVGPTRFGLTVSGPRERWPEITYLAARCARPRELRPETIERARAEVATTPGLAALALALSPDAPGRIIAAPEGAVPAQRDELVRWRDRVAVGARARIGIAGDVPLREAVTRLARIVARYPEGRPPSSAAWSGPPADLVAGRAEHPGAWVVWAVPSTATAARDLGPLCARAAARMGASALRVAEQHHVVTDGWAIAAVRVDADEATLAELPERVPRLDAAAPTAPAAPSTPTARSLALASGERPEVAGGGAAWASARPRFVVLRPAR